jgi:hypothetical protein
MLKSVLRVLTALVAVGAFVFAFSPPAGAASPSQDACHTVNNNAPSGNCGPFTQVYRENFNAVQVPLGAFSGCAGDGNFKCSGLRTRYPGYYNTLGAYPSGWGDTADPSNHSNGNNRTFGGKYTPQDTMSVIKTPEGDGQLKVHMWRPSAGGSNHVSAPVPLKCMNLRYGKFTERTHVSALTDGYKMAHLRYTPNEIDYPEAGGNFRSDPVSEFTHGFAESGADAAGNAAWTGWHTYSQEIVPGSVRFYYDGRLFKTVHADFPDTADWILQNESALAGGYAAKGSSVDITSTWLTCYRLNG